ncbi:MAG: tRNA threonylcarbamoyladenosine biosynthesis protein TsaB [Candidatus Latescibacteria bacterium ADurb.Bin168]|nr:MAG: tRNA threonylcarbamoyladenosine biosynthesis protein TsaB [Candidatus Latescibacteria bacterium ADurb.Bin168]
MTVLGIDTATPGLGVALAGPDGLIAETTIHIGLQHSQTLLPAVEWLLETVGSNTREIDGVAVTIGPGSFTAVRIGLATAKGICVAGGIPLACVSTLAASAARHAWLSFPVVPMLDAKRREVYVGLYDVSTGEPVAVEPDTVVSPHDWLENHTREALFCGDGALAYRDLITEKLGAKAHFAPPWVPLASAGVVAVLGRQKMLRGEIVEPDAATPVYLRRPQAVLP